MWLTRVWTYQEIKLARKAFIVTATHAVEFQDILSTLESRASQDKPRFYQLHRTFARLQSVYGPGINHADIALSCPTAPRRMKSTTPAVSTLSLAWSGSMHGPRGLPSPFTWAPKYLAQLQGKSWKPYYFKCELLGLVGNWHSASVCELGRVCSYGQPNRDSKLAFKLLIRHTNGETAQVVVVTWSRDWTTDLKKWAYLMSGDKSRLLCADDMVIGESFPTVLLAVWEGGIEPRDGLKAGDMGYAPASGVLYLDLCLRYLVDGC